MPAFFQQIVEQMFVGPLWPASILVCLLIIYTMMAMLGLIDFGLDIPDLDLDPGLDLDVGLDLDPGIDLDVGVDAPDVDAIPADWDFWQGIGAASVRWTNFGRVPVIIWGAAFAFAYWTVSFLLWHGFDAQRYEATWIPSTLLAVRNFVIATAITKGITQPMIKYFVGGPSYDESTLVGATCEVSTTVATEQFGQAKFRTNAAPLLLNVRTDGPHINKGTEVRIIGYDREKRIYKVTPLPAEKSS